MLGYVDDQAAGEITLEVENLEAVIAPKITVNHNETLVHDEVELEVEEVEQVIAPKLAANHNETLVSDAV
jgi:hypothetical protein